MSTIGQEGLNFADDFADVSDSLKIALPNEVPATLNIQDPSLLKSRTVQSLLQQSQDLMARLTVALKRNIDLEQRLEDQKLGFDTLQAEYDVYIDHTRFFKERISQLEFDLNQTNQHRADSEKQFADMYSNLQLAEQKRKDFLKVFHRYQKYRVRVRRISKPFINSLKTQIQEMKAETTTLLNLRNKQEDLVRDLRKKLTDAIDHIQSQHTKYETDQHQLVDYHETRYKNICEELGRYKTKVEYLEKTADGFEVENKKLTERVFSLNEEFSQKSHSLTIDYEKLKSKLKDEYEQKFREFSEKEITLQNQLIVTERRYEESRDELEIRTAEFNSKRFSLTTQINTFDVCNKSLESQNQDLKNKVALYENDTLQMRDQLDSLQQLYNESVGQAEDLKNKLNSSDKINRDLSQALSEQRRQNDANIGKITELEADFNRRLNSMGQRFQNEIKSQVKTTNQKGQTELLSRIHVLLSEIQSGYSILDTPNDESTEQLISEQGDIKT